MTKHLLLIGLTAMFAGCSMQEIKEKEVVPIVQRESLEDLEERIKHLAASISKQSLFEIKVLDDVFDKTRSLENEEYKKEIYRKTINTLGVIEEGLKEIYSPLMQYMKIIQLSWYASDEEHPIYPRGVNYAATAYAAEGRVRISIRFGIYTSTLGHEFTHIRAGNIQEFLEKWKPIVNVDPNDKTPRETAPSKYPKFGFMTKYSAGTKSIEYNEGCLPIEPFIFTEDGKILIPTWNEDPAEYVAVIYKSGSSYKYKAVDPLDLRYQDKLRLLRKYDFISEKQFNTAINSLGAEFKRE